MRAFLCLSVLSLATAIRQPKSSRSWKTHFEQYMSTLTETQSPEGFNPICQPFISEPKGKSRGLVVLNHGFTACPKFWYLLTPQLLAEGWTVMAPLMPGHGRNPNIQQNGSQSYVVKDYYEELPERKEEYMTYSDEIIEISEEYRAKYPSREMVLAGCSHGGAVSGYMAMNGKVGTWNRILLLNPFLGPPSSLGADWGLSLLRNLLPAILPAFQVVGGDTISWGEDCDHRRWPIDWRKGGHGGICQFSFKNFRGVLEFGNEVEGEARARAAKDGVFTGGVIDRTIGVGSWVTGGLWNFISGNSKPPPSDLRVQVTTTSKDDAISNERVHFAVAALKKNVKDGNSGFCVMDAEMSHVWISPIDKPADMDHWWLNATRVHGGKSALQMLTDFVSRGIFVPTSGDTVQDDKALKGDPRCDVRQRR